MNRRKNSKQNTNKSAMFFSRSVHFIEFTLHNTGSITSHIHTMNLCTWTEWNKCAEWKTEPHLVFNTFWMVFSFDFNWIRCNLAINIEHIFDSFWLFRRDLFQHYTHPRSTHNHTDFYLVQHFSQYSFDKRTHKITISYPLTLYSTKSIGLIFQLIRNSRRWKKLCICCLVGFLVFCFSFLFVRSDSCVYSVHSQRCAAQIVLTHKVELLVLSNDTNGCGALFLDSPIFSFDTADCRCSGVSMIRDKHSARLCRSAFNARIYITYVDCRLLLHF